MPGYVKEENVVGAVAEVHFGLTLHGWGILFAVISPFLFTAIWHLGLKYFFRRMYKRLTKAAEAHKEVRDLQANTISAFIFWIILIALTLIEFNSLGFGDGKAGQNLLVASGSIALIGSITGGASLAFLIAGMEVLVSHGLGIGHYCKFTHREDSFTGYVLKIGMMRTWLKSDEYGNRFVPNRVMRNFHVLNYDLGPFYHEEFPFPVPKDMRTLVTGTPPKVDPVTRNELVKGAESIIVTRIKAHMTDYIMSPLDEDKEDFKILFPQLDDTMWNWLSKPSVLLDGDTGMLRFPVRRHIEGKFVRHQIAMYNILDLTNIEEHEVKQVVSATN